MTGQMCWLSTGLESDGPKILHIRLNPSDRWQPYTAFPTLKVPDISMPLSHGSPSKGFPTMQKLLKQGFTLVPTAEAQDAHRRSNFAQEVS